MSYHRTSEAAPLRGAATMTVCTNHVALCHLVENALPGPVSKAIADAELLVSQMVELEHDRIGLATIGARSGLENLDQVPGPLVCRGLSSQRGALDVAAGSARGAVA